MLTISHGYKAAHSHELKGLTINHGGSMFYRDFQLLLKAKAAGNDAFRLIRKTFKERQSRPRAKENVINPKQKGI